MGGFIVHDVREHIISYTKRRQQKRSREMVAPFISDLADVSYRAPKGYYGIGPKSGGTQRQKPKREPKRVENNDFEKNNIIDDTEEEDENGGLNIGDETLRNNVLDITAVKTDDINTDELEQKEEDGKKNDGWRRSESGTWCYSGLKQRSSCGDRKKLLDQMRNENDSLLNIFEDLTSVETVTFTNGNFLNTELPSPERDDTDTKHNEITGYIEGLDNIDVSPITEKAEISCNNNGEFVVPQHIMDAFINAGFKKPVLFDPGTGKFHPVVFENVNDTSVFLDQKAVVSDSSVEIIDKKEEKSDSIEEIGEVPAHTQEENRIQLKSKSDSEVERFGILKYSCGPLKRQNKRACDATKQSDDATKQSDDATKQSGDATKQPEPVKQMKQAAVNDGTKQDEKKGPLRHDGKSAKNRTAFTTMPDLNRTAVCGWGDSKDFVCTDTGCSEAFYYPGGLVTHRHYAHRGGWRNWMIESRPLPPTEYPSRNAGEKRTDYVRRVMTHTKDPVSVDGAGDLDLVSHISDTTCDSDETDDGSVM